MSEKTTQLNQEIPDDFNNLVPDGKKVALQQKAAEAFD